MSDNAEPSESAEVFRERSLARRELLDYVYGDELLSEDKYQLGEKLVRNLSNSYSRFLYKLLADHEDEIVKIINEHSTNWSYDRLGILERAIIKIAVAEILYAPETPSGVAISEAMLLADDYLPDTSKKFVNGVLAAVKQKNENEARK